MEEEVWAQFHEVGAEYEVSNMGNFRALTEGAKVYKNIRKKHIAICFYFNGHKKSRLIGQTIAGYFIENPDNYKYVFFLNGDKNDYRVSNLVWSSVSKPNHFKTEKAQDYIGKKNLKGKSKKIAGVKRGRNGTPVVKLDGKLEPVAVYKSIKAAITACDFLSQHDISYAIRHKTRAGGFYWKVQEQE